MEKLTAVYHDAVAHTKKKVLEDLDQYLGVQEDLPSYQQFLEDRSEYIEQIWFNVWLNKATNKVPKKIKNSYLQERGYDIDGVNRKHVNKLFRNEIKTEEPFYVRGWLDEVFIGQEKEWRRRYEQAKVKAYEREQEQKRMETEETIKKFAIQLMKSQRLELFLQLRYVVALQVGKDLENRSGSTRMVDETSRYELMSDFFELFTKYPDGSNEDYIYYGALYEPLIDSYLASLVVEKVFNQMPQRYIHQYEEAYNHRLTGEVIERLIGNFLQTLQNDFFGMIEEEYLSDLLALAKTSFDIEEHRLIYEQDFYKRDQRKQERAVALARKEEEEARILEDIFGREYNPPLGRNIRYVLHIGETNTGKTYHALQRMKEAESGLYLAPLRLLALEVYDKLNYEGVPCSLKTGEEEKIVHGSTHIACTVEMFRENDSYDVIVIDEAQMIADKDRGFSWYKAITKANAKEVHIIGSRNAKEMMFQLLGDSAIEVHEYSRDIPLQVEKKPFKIKQTSTGDALVCFSRKRVLETAAKLQKNGHSVSLIYGSMPPETRKKQMQQFIAGETTVIVSTDAIGMGLNLPIRRIVFLENEKFDGIRRRRLTSQEIKQIAGRAGRKGIYDVGKVAFTQEIKKMRRLLMQEDKPVHTFAIAPTPSVFERFQKHYRDLGTFFELWKKFESPPGTKKASLQEERALYATIRGSEIEGRLSLMDLYGFLHMPFSKKIPELTKQWRQMMFAIVGGRELPEPNIRHDSLEELELSYQAVGLHLLFLYRLNRGTEAIYWERIREQISNEVHDSINTDVKNFTKRCKYCRRELSWEYPFSMCDDCHAKRYLMV
ncbi:helicase-related protein [Desertibacillus haloalkaliphilus]|uniref:helicase-related protein n=1 Tax=Desertibacillus haloalkaliphilus TaxID=1328930 RepID=UPI001C277B74|nr:helicase-related protein [Desertibacillus haloalkaliphilus]MBU8907944.1 RNA helicase [Desertibacillus haloalkaliphilus]